MVAPLLAQYYKTWQVHKLVVWLLAYLFSVYFCIWLPDAGHNPFKNTRDRL